MMVPLVEQERLTLDDYLCSLPVLVWDFMLLNNKLYVHCWSTIASLSHVSVIDTIMC